jgi:hypothetical protein
MLESQSEDALVILVKSTVMTVETVETVETVKTDETVETEETVLTEDLKKALTHLLTYSLTDNLKARDASAFKNLEDRYVTVGKFLDSTLKKVQCQKSGRFSEIV